MKPDEFFSKVFKKDKGDELLQEQIEAFMEKRRAAVLEKIKGKQLYEMGNDGEPTWRKIEVLENGPMYSSILNATMRAPNTAQPLRTKEKNCTS